MVETTADTWDFDAAYDGAAAQETAKAASGEGADGAAAEHLDEAFELGIPEEDIPADYDPTFEPRTQEEVTRVLKQMQRADLDIIATQRRLADEIASTTESFQVQIRQTTNRRRFLEWRYKPYIEAFGRSALDLLKWKRKSLALDAGELKFRDEPEKIELIDGMEAAMLTWAIAKMPQPVKDAIAAINAWDEAQFGKAIVKVDIKAVWGNIKRGVVVSGTSAVWSETGEKLDFVQVIARKEKVFSIDLNLPKPDKAK